MISSVFTNSNLIHCLHLVRNHLLQILVSWRGHIQGRDRRKLKCSNAQMLSFFLKIKLNLNHRLNRKMFVFCLTHERLNRTLTLKFKNIYGNTHLRMHSPCLKQKGSSEQQCHAKYCMCIKCEKVNILSRSNFRS